MKANSLTIKKVREAAKERFSSECYRVFWEEDTLRLYFKEEADVLATVIFSDCVKRFLEVDIKYRIEASDSGLWN